MKFINTLTLALLASGADVVSGRRGSRNSRSGSSFSRWGTTSSTTSTSTTTTTTSTSTSSSSSTNSKFDECVTSSSDDHILQCSGHVGTVYGDPHITTFDGYASSCQAQGEFILVESSGEMEIQARFERLGDVSVTKGIASSVSGVVDIQVSFSEYDSGSASTIDMCSNCDLHLYIGGELQDANVGDTFSGTGYTVEVKSSSVDVQYFDGTTPTSAWTVQPKYSSRRGFCYLTTYFCLSSSDSDLVDNARGLLGTPNHDCSDDFVTSNGVSVDEPTSTADRFDYCTSYYCVATEGDSLFVHEDDNGGMSFSELEGCNDIAPPEVDTSNPSEEVLEVCGEDNEECILDATVLSVEDAVSTVETQDTTIAIVVSETVVDTTPDTSCPYDIVWLHTEGSADFDQFPITIVSQDGDSAVLKVQSASFSSMDIQYVEYEEQYQQKCISETSVSTSYTEEITISCPGSEAIALVHVVASDSNLDPSVDTGVLDECCHADSDTNGKVKFTFMVHCEPQCPEDE